MDESTRILITEHDEQVAQRLVESLATGGLLTEILQRGENTIERVRRTSPDFVILDLKLPEIDGIAMCQEIRKFSSVPIMILTAHISEADRLNGFNAGADDYVCKPFYSKEILARVTAIFRRTRPNTPFTDQTISYKFLTLVPDRYLCRVMNEQVELTPVEFQMLKTMISQPGIVFPRDKLKPVDKLNKGISDRAVDAHIKNLRKKLLKAEGSENLIRTVHGVGYKLE